MLGEKSDVTEEDLREMVYLEQVCAMVYQFVAAQNFR